MPATGPLGAEDLRRVRFSLAFRGYRMSEVDNLLDRLASELEPSAARSPEEVVPEPAPEDAPEPVRGDGDTP